MIKSWIKTLINFLQLFKEYPDELLNSIGWVITKSPSELTNEQFTQRLKEFKRALKSEKFIDGSVLDKFIDGVVEDTRYFFFRKTTGNENTQHEEMNNIYKQMNKMTSYSLNKDHLKEQLSWSKEEQESASSYFEGCENNMVKTINAVKEMIAIMIDDNSFQKFKEIKKNYG